MFPPDILEDQTDFLKIQLKSEAFEEGIPLFYKENPEKYYENISEVHKILYRMDKKDRPLSINIEYKPLTTEDLDQVVSLHTEWFPFSYDRDYFKKFILRKNFVTLGAFLKLGYKTYLVGCAIGEVISEKKFRTLFPGILVERSWYDLFSSWENCGYLHSIGVIDEYRKRGVGTKLLEMFIEEMKKKNCIVIYGNIIEHNISAIKFIEAYNWHFYGILQRHFRFNEKLYNGKVYYYVLDMNWCNLKDQNILNSENGNGINELNSQKRGCWESLFGYFSSEDTNKNEEKKDITSSEEIK